MSLLQNFRKAIMALICKPIAHFWFGLNLLHKERLPEKGPAIIIANHNSHLDTFLLLTLFKTSLLDRLKPVAAADYFLKGGFSSWVSLRLIGILPVTRERKREESDPLQACYRALERGDILIIFPEGSRGAPEEMSNFKTGIARIARQFPEVPVVPIYLQNAGRALPKGKHIPVPFVFTAIIGEALTYPGDRAEFMDQLRSAMAVLKEEAPPLKWPEQES